jgi:hypothetical protein
MQGKIPIDTFYDEHVAQPSEAYRATIGPPVHLDAKAFDAFVAKLVGYRDLYPNVSFWQIVDYKSLRIIQSDGDRETFGYHFTSFKDFFRVMHPDYVRPYLRWRTAAFELIYSQKVELDPLNIAYRFGMPMQVQNQAFYWFTMNSTIVQIDAKGQLVTSLQTFYREGKWSPRNLRPVEASLTFRSAGHDDLEKQIITQLSLKLIDEFTNAELDVLALYAAGKTHEEVKASKGWSRHTLHEYNANILRKAKLLFVYNFRSARNFAEYCAEKGFIQFQ